MWVFRGACAVGGLLQPSGWSGSDVACVGRVELVVWALDEVVRGANPWRRILGATVLVWQLASALT